MLPVNDACYKLTENLIKNITNQSSFELKQNRKFLQDFIILLFNEKSLQARLDIGNEFLNRLVIVKNSHDSSKRWYQKALACLGIRLTPKEKFLVNSVDKISKLLAIFQKQQNIILLGGKLNLKEKFLNWSGIRTLPQQVSKYVKNEIKRIATANLEEKIRQCAFRCVKFLDQKEKILVTESQPKTRALSGTPTSYSIFYLKKDLEELILKYSTHFTFKQLKKCQEVLKALNDALYMANHLSFIKSHSRLTTADKEKFLADLTYKIAKEVRSLQVKQFILIPAGYLHKKSSHAMFYQIKRTHENEYAFAVYNPNGEEYVCINEEGKLTHDAKSYWYPQGFKKCEVITKNLTLEKVSDRNFLSNLLRYDILSLKQPRLNIYYLLEKEIFSKGKRKITNTYFFKQTWGTCTYDAGMNFLSNTFKEEFFKFFESYVMQKAKKQLLEYLPIARKKHLFNSEVLDLLEKKASLTVEEIEKQKKQVRDKSDAGVRHWCENFAKFKYDLSKFKYLKKEQPTYYIEQKTNLLGEFITEMINYNCRQKSKE